MPNTSFDNQYINLNGYYNNTQPINTHITSYKSDQFNNTSNENNYYFEASPPYKKRKLNVANSPSVIMDFNRLCSETPFDSDDVCIDRRVMTRDQPLSSVDNKR
eukprot:467566_1